MAAPDDVLDYWFGAPGTAERGRPRSLWFTKSVATDAEIRARFGPLVEAALHGALDHWRATPRGALALILLLDQFTRNIFRDTPRAFAGDAAALALAQQLVAAGGDRTLDEIERRFVYMPYEHAESLEMQREGVRLFEQLANEGPDSALAWAQKHLEVIARFGRFPHRNEILGRASTAAEIEYLKQPGSRF
jgi:uncharacterized protein (DUF924 family)